MANSTNTIRIRASEWLEHRYSGQWSVTDQHNLDNWLAISPAHRVAYLRVLGAWQKADRLVVLHNPGFGKIRQQTRHPLWQNLTRVAAALIIASAIGAALIALPSQKTQTYATEIGARKTITLSDGTRIELNTDTQLRVAYKPGKRQVFLDKGEAFFDVTHDEKQPFIVTMGHQRVTDLGTQFTIRRDNKESVAVTLIEGLAEYDRTNSTEPSTRLKPGDMLIATATSQAVTKHNERAMRDSQAWRRGVLIFNRTTLAEAAAELNRYNSQKLVITDPNIASLRINGTFPSNDVPLFGRVAKLVLGVTVETKGNDLVISK